jgi:zinc transport system permease protein
VLWTIAFSTLSCLVGVWAPMRFEIPVPSGGAIILTAAAIFLVTLVIRMTVPRFREASL